MGKPRKNKSKNSKPEAVIEENAAVETATDVQVEVAANDEAELEAALAMLADEGDSDGGVEGTTEQIEEGGDSGTAFEIEEGTEVALDAEEIDVEAEAKPEDVDAALAALEEQDKPAEPKSKTKSAGTPTPAVPVRAFTDVAQIDEAELKNRLGQLKAKKVHEKAQNLIAAIEGRKAKLSRYTRDAVKHLAAEGKVSGKSLTDMFLAAGLKEGTARAQSQQMTALFKTVGAAEPSPGNPRELVVSDQGLVDEMLKLAA